MNPDAKRAMDEGADFIASDTMPAAEPTPGQTKARELAKKFATETLDEYRAQVENDPTVKERLARSFDEALTEIMLEDNLSANDGAEGEAFFKAAQGEKDSYVKFLMNDMINKHIEVEEEINSAGKEYMSRLAKPN